MKATDDDELAAAVHALRERGGSMAAMADMFIKLGDGALADVCAKGFVDFARLLCSYGAAIVKADSQWVHAAVCRLSPAWRATSTARG